MTNIVVDIMWPRSRTGNQSYFQIPVNHVYDNKEMSFFKFKYFYWSMFKSTQYVLQVQNKHETIPIYIESKSTTIQKSDLTFTEKIIRIVK